MDNQKDTLAQPQKNGNKIRRKLPAALAGIALLSALAGCNGIGGTQQTQPNPSQTQTPDFVEEETIADIYARYDKANKDFIRSYDTGLDYLNLDSQSEYDSLKFYDIFTSDRTIYVRYTGKLDGADYQSCVQITYQIANTFYNEFKRLTISNEFNSVGDFIWFFLEYPDTSVVGEGRGAFIKRFDDSRKALENERENGVEILNHYTEEDISSYLNSLETNSES